MHQALYRKFRPEVFESILGQNHIVKILQNQVKSNTVGHAYLFCGTRGTGKTTTARILAKGVNCTAEPENRPCGICENCQDIRDGVFIDVIEIDAASNNGVENIRELRESVKYAPAKGRYKVYIIDEVHMLSSGAFNALLKTLEEPPQYVIFILATTEPFKLPATVLSRCMRLDFRRVPEQIIIDNMKRICETEGVAVEESGLRLIAANGDGSVRDSLSLLDKTIASGEKNITRQDVLGALGTRGEEDFIELTEMVINGSVGDVLLHINNVINMGIDSKQFLKDWTGHYRNLLLLKYLDKAVDILNLSEENIARMKDQSSAMDLNEINNGIYTLAEAYSDARWSSQPRIHLELAAARLAGGRSAPAEAPVGVGSGMSDRPSSPARTKTEPESKPEPKATLEIKVEPSTKAETESKSDGDIAKLWEEALKEGESKKASLNMLGKNCMPLCDEDGCIILEMSTPTAFRLAEENKEYLQELVCKYSGKPMRLECKMAENEDGKEKGKNPHELAEEIGDRLNIEVEIV